jgi:hypothetical protein
MLSATTTMPSAAPLSAASVRFAAIDAIPSDGRQNAAARMSTKKKTSAKWEEMHRRAAQKLRKHALCPPDRSTTNLKQPATGGRPSSLSREGSNLGVIARPSAWRDS